MIEREEALTEEGRARRRFLKQAGTVAWASPLILTMMSRTAQAQFGPCGVQVESPEPPFAMFCQVTAPCGTAIPCVPNRNNFGAGNPCVCLVIT